MITFSPDQGLYATPISLKYNLGRRLQIHPTTMTKRKLFLHYYYIKITCREFSDNLIALYVLKYIIIIFFIIVVVAIFNFYSFKNFYLHLLLFYVWLWGNLLGHFHLWLHKIILYNIHETRYIRRHDATGCENNKG